ncbi:3-hydroxyacyl-CoA dehydrogenase NAD-binding domain-containing protein [Alphaproteobacteria bacterium]|nr:3-hydroxyacyl-CoA dehydrogenase NAD-binding domain-containing protein [Alphaproteobacteria bacterium]
MQDLKHWSVSIDDANLCWLTLDVSGKSVNVLTHAVMAELDQIIEWVEGQSMIAGVGMLSGKPGGFVYGADIAEFELLTTADDVLQHMQMVHALFNRIDSLGVPTIVGIDGIAVGGGLEIALTFDRIITTAGAKTKLGFPEVNLGILPGYGGSGRAYRRIGTAAVAQMMMSGRPLTASAAQAAGLIDQSVDDAAALQPAMTSWLIAQNRAKPHRQQRETAADQKALDDASAQFLTRLRADHTPAPFAIIEHVRRYGHAAAAMSAGEMDIFPELMVGSASKNLRRVYYLTDNVRKTARGDSAITNLHVVGAGVMGGDIAAVAAMTGLTVSLTDMNAGAIETAINRATKLFERRLKSDNKIAAAKQRLQADPSGGGAARADLVIEAVAEKLSVKQAVFRALETVIKPDAILATNTSAIPLEDIATALQDPSRLIGLHFFNPVPVLPLVEVIWSRHSDQNLISRGMQFAGQIGKMPIRCQSAPGFLVNRALLPYMFKAVEAVASGENADQIDEALVDFGMPMGPIELCDQVGLDVCLDAGMVLGIAPPAEKILRAYCAAQNLGRKTGSGFYQWDGNRPIRPRAAVDAAVMADIAASMLAPMIEQCQQAVDAGIVDSADSADAGMIFGTGFPGFRGGPLHWSKQ